MATLIINVSGGNVHLDSMNMMLQPGARKEFQCTESELVALCPELSTLKLRMRLVISEDAIEPDAQPTIIAPVEATVVEVAPVPEPAILEPQPQPPEQPSVAPVAKPKASKQKKNKQQTEVAQDTTVKVQE